MYINRKISQQPENWENRNDSDLVQAFPKKWWVESDFTKLLSDVEARRTPITYTKFRKQHQSLQ